MKNTKSALEKKKMILLLVAVVLVATEIGRAHV